MKKCKSFEKQLAAYINGELDERKTEALEAHVEGCKACRTELAAHRETLDLLGETLAEAPAPEQLSTRHTVPQCYAAPTKTLSDYWYNPRFKTALVTAAACSVVIFAGLGLLIPRMGGRTYDAIEQVASAAKDEAAQGGAEDSDSIPVQLTTIERPKMQMKKPQISSKVKLERTSGSRGTATGNRTPAPEPAIRPKKSADDSFGMAGFGDRIIQATAQSGISQDRFVMQEVKEFNTEQYSRIVDNAFKLVTQHPLSTFSIDVDRASYANVRRFLSNNRLPPPDAVRIEEMINYFSYDYPQPEGEDPFSVSMELTECPWNADHRLALIGLQGREIDTADLPPNNLVFLLDVSGSMNDPDKLPLLKSAMRLLVNELRPDDRVSIVVYAGAAGRVLEPTSDKAKIIEAINRLSAGGSTAGGAGIVLAYKTAQESFLEEGNNRVILATDGDFNIGVSSDGDLVRLIEEKRETGIFLSVLGFGTGNYKDSKMEQLADKGNGNYAYIDNILEAKKVLVKEMGGTLVTIAKDVKLQIEFNPAEIKAYRLIGYENRVMAAEDFEDDRKDAGELGAGHTVTALYELIPAGSDEEVPAAGDLKYQTTGTILSDEMMTVKLRYKQPDGDTSKLITQSVKAGDLKAGDSSNITFAGAVAEFGLLLRNSEHKGTADYDQVLRRAKQSKGSDDEGYRAEFIRLVEKAQLLDTPEPE